MDYDVVVVGAGASGISAALSAAQNGAKVALLEKGDKFGGAGMFGAQGLFAVGSKEQLERGEEYTIKDAYEEIMNYTHHSSNARMTKAILRESADTIEWMRQNGLDTELVTNTQEVHQNHPRTYHQFIDKFNGFQRVMDNFINAGGTLLTETSGKEIITEGNKVVGIKVITKDEEKVLTTNNVILADGGFVGNKDEVNQYAKIDSNDMYSMGERKAVGDGLRMLKEVGGVNNYKRIFENHAATVYSKKSHKWHNNTIFSLTNLPTLWIDREGKRFTNEDIVYDFALWGDTVYQAGGYYYFLLDQKLVDYLKKNSLNWTDSFERTFRLLDGKPMTYKVGPFESIEQDLQEAIDEGAGFKADSVEELAEQINVSPTSLSDSVKRYNHLVKKGEDTDFYKDNKFMNVPVEDGPFYAIRANSTTLGTVGGGLVNEDFQALTSDRKVIPGVYVVGNNAGGLFDSSYPTIEGLSNAFAWNSGRIAGKFVAKNK
ncbi:fumarate reductase flavoprotein subunit [Lactobacillus colini]|uniref:Fumarate reductase flavoprotein subunit n=1 Tax=Lactobacillus colini TaxID=1819254 RepID=A0ABS4MEU9_9LACO|nr:FAD-dependent oxidoreductase [Lactobacillus colini]MBP2058215.1 fumarate reductase flavoprotein subunit [Lactobacillus colini]